MKKIKKYIYPFIFAISFLALYIALAWVLTAVLDGGSYAGGALALLFIMAWVLFVLPFYCVKYSKIIIDEKLKFLFSAYNCLVLIIIHQLPFYFDNSTYRYLYMFFVWVVFWNVLPLALRLISRKNIDNPLKKEEAHLINSLLQNKTKNITAICITCIYIITLIKDNAVWQFYDIKSFLLYTLPLISSVFILVFLFSKNKEYILKKWLLSFALAGELISGLFSICLSLSSLDIQLKYNPMYPVSLTFSCLMIILIAIMFIGTLFNFKHIKLLKYGALGHVILSVGLLIFNLINVGGIAYHQVDMNGTLAVNTSIVIELLLRALRFMGIFILTTSKRNVD